MLAPVQRGASGSHESGATFAKLRSESGGGVNAMDDRLITDNLALAKYVAKKYANADLEYDDVLQLAYEGLVRAARTFKQDKWVAFSTYAVTCMECWIWQQFRKKRIRAESLNDPLPDTEHLTWADVVEDPVDAAEDIAVQDALVHALDQLPTRERYIIETQFLRDPPLTQSTIAQELGMRQSAVSRITKRALRKLREYMIGGDSV